MLLYCKAHTGSFDGLWEVSNEAMMMHHTNRSDPASNMCPMGEPPAMHVLREHA